MDARPGLAVTGAAGRMGQTVLRLAAAAPAFRLVAALERPGHPALGRDAGEAGGGPTLGVRLGDDAVAAFARAQAVIDFTSPAASVAHAGLAAQARAVHVIGTTGFGRDDLAAIARAARHAAIVRAGNMSVGVNLLVGLVARVAAALGPEFDVEILEAHHRAKVDAPSGTALMLGEAAAKGRGVALDEVADRVRDGVTGPRAEGHIGFASLRGGDIVGEHDVLFAGPGERLVLRHVATDRTIFARGALRAAAWGLGRPPGEYTMADVLGL
ncbi:MAG: 4-hydroxy-tetrahydrodipicolinate reductase [Rhodobacteraceae bacterium]|nr:4-hydroxy-tetrahydrodipicolinate reductase [Paracoccaceae bacterium]